MWKWNNRIWTLQVFKIKENDKSPGNNGFTKEFYETFWEEIKTPFSISVQNSFLTGELSTSQKQAVTKRIEKKDRDKRFTKKWRPISLLNVDSKLISKSLAIRLQDVMPNLVSETQSA